MKNLWFVSGFFLILASCSSFICKNPQTDYHVSRRVLTGFTNTENVLKFKSNIRNSFSEFSGILILKKLGDSTMAGGFINEFGIKIFDFTMNEKNTRVGYLFNDLDIWYIRRRLETDLHFLFSEPKLQTRCLINDTTVFVANVNRSLHYVYYINDEKKMVRADMFRRASKIASLKQYTNNQAEIVLKMRYLNGSLSYEFCEFKD
jgi:hypothetical protein